MKKEFLNCLRIQICPGFHEDERIAGVIEHCKKYGFNNVMVFINTEEFNYGHMTKEEAKPWLETIKKTKKILLENGISFSLNPWMELGHLDRCRPLKPDQKFTTQIDYDGNECTLVACPLCENWKEYFLDFYTYIIKETDPDTVWIEDDFRLHNHGDLKFGGCFCDLHMKKYNEKLGTNYTREEFTDRLFRKNPDKRVRKAWLDVNREGMVALANDIGKAIADLGLNTKVGLMSSMHQKHALEGRDWHGLQKGLAQDGPIIDRLHLPCYHEISGKEYYLEFNRIPYICRELLPKGTIIYPELELGSFTTFTKDPRFLRFQLESAIPLCIDGMTYNMYDFVGNGVLDWLGYGPAIKEVTPYLNGVLNLNLDYQSISGVILPIDEKTAYKRNAEIKCFDDLYPDESMFGAYLSSIGINTKVSSKKKFKGEIVALGCGNAYNFTKSQLEDLFKNNYVIVEGGAALILVERGLGYLINAKNAKKCWAEHDVYSYEEVAGDKEIYGLKNYRCTTFAKSGDYVNIEYDKKVEEKSFVYDYLGNKFGIGDVDGGNFFVIPYVINERHLEQYNTLRTTLLKDFIKKTENQIILTNYAGVYAYLFKKRNKDILIVVNSTEMDFDTTNLEIRNIDFNKVSCISRKTGKKRPVKFTKSGNDYKFMTKCEHLTTQTFILSK